ncbi:MAG: VOC family protein [Burkholderiaceae bacterium]|nr:VOC family protein [Burkholderiaceae bacterium]
MDVYKTHGAFSWSELMTPNPKAALAFYGDLFGWTSQEMDMGSGAYHVVKVGDTQVAGVMGMPPDTPPGMPPMWGCYVTVDDIDATAKRCIELGGQVLMPPMDIPTVGRMAVLKDPLGAVISAITYTAGA